MGSLSRWTVSRFRIWILWQMSQCGSFRDLQLDFFFSIVLAGWLVEGVGEMKQWKIRFWIKLRVNSPAVSMISRIFFSWYLTTHKLYLTLFISHFLFNFIYSDEHRHLNQETLCWALGKAHHRALLEVMGEGAKSPAFELTATHKSKQPAVLEGAGSGPYSKGRMDTLNAAWTLKDLKVP